MTREESIIYLKQADVTVGRDIKTKTAEALEMAIKALEQESIDYKAQYERFSKKAEIVISQLRADRDRLQDAFDKIRSEIERERSFQRAIDEYDIATGLRKALEILDKYNAEAEDT